MAYTGELLLQRYNKLLNRHQTNRNIMSEIAFYFDPDNFQYSNEVSPGGDRNNDHEYKNLLYDTTCRDYKDELVDFTLGRIIDPSFSWLKLMPADPSILAMNTPEATSLKIGLGQLEEQFAQVLSASSFYPEATQWYENGGDYGFGACSIYPKKSSNKLHIRAENPFHIVFDEDDSKNVNEVFFESVMTGSQILSKFGEEKFIKLIKKAEDETIVSIRADSVNSDDVLRLHKEYRVVTGYIKHKEIWKEFCVDRKSHCVLREENREYNPCIVYRMDRSSSLFGKGWGKKCLERAITLDKIKHDFFRASNWAVNPVWQIMDDEQIPDEVNPGDRLYGDLAAGDLIKPANMNIRPEYALQAYEIEREASKKAFKIDAFDFQKKEKQSIAEISEFASMRNVKVSRFVYRFITEGLVPFLRSAYYIAVQQGIIVKPESIQNVPIKIDIVSPLFAQQRYNKITNVTRAFQASAPATEVDPAARHMINGKRLVSDIFSEFGLANVLNTEDEADAKAEEEKQATMQGIDSKAAKDRADAEKSLATAEQIKNEGKK